MEEIGIYYCLAHAGVANEDDTVCDFYESDPGDDDCDFRACFIDRDPKAKVTR